MRLFTRQRKPAHDPVEISEKNGVRFLHLGGPAIQSAMRIREPYALELEYTRAMLAFVMFHPAPREIALLGLGGGSIAKFIHRHLLDSRLTALEVNPEVVAAARTYFSLPADDKRLRVCIGDGAAYIRDHVDGLDVLLVDAYDAHRIVEDLASLEFYRDCARALRPGGLALFNLWGSDKHFEAYLERIEAAFAGKMLLLPAEKKGNMIVLAFTEPLPDLGFAVLGRSARLWETSLGLEFPRFLERLRSVNVCLGDRFCL
jgi:spermidine synthase